MRFLDRMFENPVISTTNAAVNEHLIDAESPAPAVLVEQTRLTGSRTELINLAHIMWY